MPSLPNEVQGIYAVYPPGRFTQPKVPAFIDFLVHAFAEKARTTGKPFHVASLGNPTDPVSLTRGLFLSGFYFYAPIS